MIHSLWTQRNAERQSEGYVIRVSDQFVLGDWNTSIAKWVRKNHVQTNEHWMQQEIIPNQLD
jgi:hypothetical protein